VEALVGDVENALEGAPVTMVGKGVGMLLWERGSGERNQRC
jgi:hypothetical protein